MDIDYDDTKITIKKLTIWFLMEEVVRRCGKIYIILST